MMLGYIFQARLESAVRWELRLACVTSNQMDWGEINEVYLYIYIYPLYGVYQLNHELELKL